MKKHNITIEERRQLTVEFITWIQRLANKHGNKKFDSIRKLEIELTNDLFDGKITLAYAEEAYLRSSGVTFFGVASSTDLQ